MAMSRVLLPAGNKDNYTALNREFFYDTTDKNLYIRYNDSWVLIGGATKQNLLEGNKNIEIVFQETDTHQWGTATIQLADDIDIDTMTLSKNLDIPRWKGMRKIGEVADSNFFPLINYNRTSKDIIGGQFLLKLIKDTETSYESYQLTINASATRASIFGACTTNGVTNLDLVTYEDGSKSIGIKLPKRVEKVKKVTQQEAGTAVKDVYLNITDINNIKLTSNEYEVKLNRRTDFYSQYNTSGSAYDGCWWYEISMYEFRKITGIPEYTGTDLDLFTNATGYMYFDIYLSTSNTFSIDRVFVTNSKAYSDDDCVSEGRVFCHNQAALTDINDKHTVDVSDGLGPLDEIFRDDEDNETYTPGQNIQIMHVEKSYEAAEITQEVYEDQVPKKIECWFNGWDTRSDSSIPDLNQDVDDFISSKIIARG